MSAVATGIQPNARGAGAPAEGKPAGLCCCQKRAIAIGAMLLLLWWLNR